MNALKKIENELCEGMELAKCRRCGCMKATLETLEKAVPSVGSGLPNGLGKNIESWKAAMEPIEYACLGCQYCYPAVAMNVFSEAYPEAAAGEVACSFELPGRRTLGRGGKERIWPPDPGEYIVLCEDGGCAVALSTLGSVDLVDEIAAAHPKEVCIVGKTETENIGIDKVIKNTISNGAIRFLVLAGSDPTGHFPGHTLLSLSTNGVDERMRVIGSNGKRPILRNVTLSEIESFRKQVEVVDMIGCEDVQTILERIKQLSMARKGSCSCAECNDTTEVAADVENVEAREPKKIEMDSKGYFVVLPQPEIGRILIEHYSYDDKLLRRIEGKDARSLYWTIIENNWVTQLSHSAYLGKELTKAELSLKFGFKYTQDGA